MNKILRIIARFFLDVISSLTITIKTPFIDFTFAPFENNPTQTICVGHFFLQFLHLISPLYDLHNPRSRCSFY